MKKEQLLLERLKRYVASDAYPLHMPGHKRQWPDSGFPDPFRIDITEIDGFDNLHHPEGILKESMEWASELYGSDKTYYLVNGSSCGILSAVCAAVRPQGEIMVSRNCHKSAYNGIILNRMKKTDIYPQVVETLGISGGILSNNVDELLNFNPNIEAVLIVSPTYDGIVSDIRGIAEVVHKHGIPLIVDEAHGAHFSFSNGIFPESAVRLGADIVIQSLHKTLPSLTQTAVLHVKKGYVDIERLERYLQIFQSSSPSYVFMASIEKCIFEMSENSDSLYQEFGIKIKKLRKALAGMKNIRLLDRSFCGQKGIYDVDESKLVISVRGCIFRDECGRSHPADGMWLSGKLRKEFHLETEMAGADYVLAILTCFDTDDGLERLKEALLQIDQELFFQNPELSEQNCLSRPGKAGISENGLYVPIKKMEVFDAAEAVYEAVPLSDCAGRISAEFINLYPPGIPLIVPGELITEDILQTVLEYQQAGFPVQGLQDMDGMIIRVVEQFFPDQAGRKH